jgi:hypothetical protein
MNRAEVEHIIERARAATAQRRERPCWYFALDGVVVRLRARFTSDDGAIGDACQHVEPGQTFEGIAFETMRRRRAGRLIFRGGKWRVAS